MKILAIETSCDETAAAIVEEKSCKIKVLSSVVSSQAKLHAKWGGVVPNLAAREHLKNIFPIIRLTLKKARVEYNKIDLIAVTSGPGLIPALLIGLSTAKTLAYFWKKPLLGIHHIEGHIYANFIGKDSKCKIKNSKFPILCLVVSGGHTQLILMKKHLDYKIIGETLDDAAGEAFDKVARILKLGYPGGPIIASLAAKFKVNDLRSQIVLPRPMINSADFDFSFSGLKTAVLYLAKKESKKLADEKFITAVCAEFQQAVIDILTAKTLKAAQKYRPKTIMLAGGVSANQELRKQLKQTIRKNLKSVLCMMPDRLYSVDNAAMIGAAACFRWKKISPKNKINSYKNWFCLEGNANLKLR